MKKFLLFIFIVLNTIGFVSGQYLVSPVKKVIPNHSYSIQELKYFINSNDPIVDSWVNNFLILVQDGLLKCDEDLFIVKEGNSNPKKVALDIIDNYCFLTIRNLEAGFRNSGRTKSNIIKFVIDPRSFSNMEFLTFKYGSCEKDIVKMNCFNLPDLKERKIFVPKPETEIKPVLDTMSTAPQSVKEDKSLPDDYGGGVVKGNTTIKTQKAWTYEKTESSPKKKKEVKILWFVIPVTAILAGVATALILKKSKSSDGVPGGAPITKEEIIVPPVVNPPVVTPPPTGGPGGAPITK